MRVHVLNPESLLGSEALTKTQRRESFLQCGFQYRLQIVAMPTYEKLSSLFVNLNSYKLQGIDLNPPLTGQTNMFSCQPTA